MAVQQIMQIAPTDAGERIRHSDDAAKWWVGVSLFNVILFGVLGLIAAIKMVMPGLFDGVSWLSWARVRPAHVNGVVFGWLVPIAIGLFQYFIPRLSGTTLYSEKIPKISLVFWQIGVLIGTISLLNPWGGELEAGTLNPWLMTKGKEWEDYNVISNVFITIGLLGIDYNVFRTIAKRRYRQIYVATWYAVGMILWTSLVYVIGNWPGQQIDWTLHNYFGQDGLPHFGFTGSNDMNVNWFYGHSIVGLVATPGAIALAYYFLPKSINAPLYSHKLSIIGFWTLGAIYFWVGAHHMIYGPIPYWLQTVATVFSFLLFIPVAAAVINFLGTARGEWHQLRYNVPFKFFMAATVMYALVSSQGSFEALRPVQAVVHFTDYTIGHAHLALFGFATMFAFGAVIYAAPRMWRRPLYSEGMAEWSFWLAFIGITVYVLSLTVGGIYQGKLWMDYPHMPFIETVVKMTPFWHARAGGGLLMVLSMVLVAFNVYKTATTPAPVDEASTATPTLAAVAG
ncbi:MAG TPA: cbb3-type cytochrome c oxidase subunit I [Capsulimonadaceae bacterium]|jgi:cytochrome c oxidase cbb3-type subunit 1